VTEKHQLLMEKKTRDPVFDENYRRLISEATVGLGVEKRELLKKAGVVPPDIASN
jgi:hypothetical protein